MHCDPNLHKLRTLVQLVDKLSPLNPGSSPKVAKCDSGIGSLLKRGNIKLNQHEYCSHIREELFKEPTTRLK